MQKENKVFSFEDITSQMTPIKDYLLKENAIELEFDITKAATTSDTQLVKVDGKKAKIKVPTQNNVYFIFDKDFRCRYVGKKGTEKTINSRLKLHLKANNTLKKKNPTYSCIKKVCEYVNAKNKTLYLITLCIEPNFMAEGVESYFIDHFRGKGEADWVKRK